MYYTKRSLVVLGAAAIILSGCVSSVSDAVPGSGDFIYRGHDFGPDRNSDYRKGVMDGCRTSDGDYSKDHALFKTSESYHAGWEHGRLHCNGTSAT